MTMHEISLVLVLAILVLVSACSERQAQTAVQTSLTSIAHGVRAVDDVGDEAYAEAAQEARESVLVDPEDLDSDQMFDRYNELMTPWDRLVTAVELSTQVLLLGQSAVSLWISSGSLSGDWGRFCDELGPALSSVVEILGIVDVDVPPLLEQAVPLATSACDLAVDYFTGDGQ